MRYVRKTFCSICRKIQDHCTSIFDFNNLTKFFNTILEIISDFFLLACTNGKLSVTYGKITTASSVWDEGCSVHRSTLRDADPGWCPKQDFDVYNVWFEIELYHSSRVTIIIQTTLYQKFRDTLKIENRCWDPQTDVHCIYQLIFKIFW